MGRRASNIAGITYGRLTVLRRTPGPNTKASYWICQCSCGNMKIATASHLNSARVASCGCLLEEARSKLKLSKQPREERLRKRREYYAKTRGNLPPHPHLFYKRTRPIKIGPLTKHIAQIKINGRLKVLGMFKTRDEAIQAHTKAFKIHYPNT